MRKASDSKVPFSYNADSELPSAMETWSGWGGGKISLQGEELTSIYRGPGRGMLEKLKGGLGC